MRQAGARQLSKGELIQAARSASLRRHAVETRAASLARLFWFMLAVAFLAGAATGAAVVWRLLRP